MKSKFTVGRTVIMEEANTEIAHKSAYGKVVEFLPKTEKSICDHVKVQWESGETNITPAHFLGTFSCND
jgi:hypothetical protein